MIGIMATSALSVPPIVIAHRGACGERPEHSIAAYALAIEQGADFIEPDLVMTRDGVMVARHENEIGGTTNVASHPEFASRRRTKSIDGRLVTGWFTEDFTLAELKRLRVRERLPALRAAVARAYDDIFDIPTFDEILALVATANTARGRPVGIYCEIKHSSYFASLGLPIEPQLVESLTRAGYMDPRHPVFIQSFEVANLKALRGMTKLRLVQLVGEDGAAWDRIVAGAPSTAYREMLRPAGLDAIAGYADAIGPAKGLIVPRDRDNALLAPTSLVVDAHRAGLLVHPWTFRNENQFLPSELRREGDHGTHGNAIAEYRMFFDLGIDGLFSDFPATAIAARAIPSGQGG